MEVWKDIAGYEGLYQVSNMGRVKTMARLHREDRPYVKKERVMKPPVNSVGYPQVALYKNKKGVIHSVHKLVATAFIERLPEHQVVNHKDGNKQNNLVSNLEWCTYSHNHRHAIRTGLIVLPMGEDHYASKVTNAQRDAIYRIYKAGMSQKEIGNWYGISQPSVSDIIIKADCRLLPESFPHNGVLVVRG
jgi:hypothetical protein